MELEAGMYDDFSDNFVLNKLREMEKEFVGKSPFYTVMLNNIAQYLLIKVVRNCFKSQSNTKDYCILYVQKYIDEHFKESIDLSQLTEMSGYSYDWFRHLFKVTAGMSLHKYITDRKLRHASTLLADTERTITEISNECSFSSTSQFIVLFKRFKKMTPGQYRSSVKDKNHVDLYNL